MEQNLQHEMRGRGVQRPFETFPKVQSFWWRHPSQKKTTWFAKFRRDFLKAPLGWSHPSKNQVPRSLLSFLKTEWFYLAFTFCHCSAMVCPGNITKCISDLRVGGFCQRNCPNAKQLQQVKNKLWPNNRDWFVSTAFPKGSCNILSSEFPPLKVAPYPHNGKCWCQKISRIERYPNP